MKTPTKTKKKVRKVIPFAELPKEKQRILILKDALKYIQIGKFKPNTGIVIDLGHKMFQEVRQEDQFQSVLKKFTRSKKQKPCDVCERGALLCALVLRDNKFPISSISGIGTASEPSENNKRLQEVFEMEQLAMMETAFEGAYNFFLLDFDLHAKCCRFGNKYETYKGKAKAILQNAIKNKGIFTP